LDNTQLNLPTTLGDIIATDDIGGFKLQRTKTCWGVDGTFVDTSLTDPLPIQGSVTITSVGGVVDTELPAAVLLTDNTANPTTTSVGVFPHWWDGATWDRAPGNSADGLLVNLGLNNDVTVTGTVAVSSVGGTVAVTQSTSPWVVSGTVAVSGSVDTELPAAASLTDNFANPTAPAVGAFAMLWDGATWDRFPGTSVDGALVNLGANNDVTVTSGSITVANAAGASAVNIQDGGNSITVDGTVAVSGINSIATGDNLTIANAPPTISLLMGWDAVGSNWDRLRADPTLGLLVQTGAMIPGTGATNLGKAEDAVHTTGDVGVMMLGVRNDLTAQTVGSGTAGDYTFMAVDTYGNTMNVGNIPHDGPDIGGPMKVGGKATDYEPDTTATPAGGRAEVAEDDRVDEAHNRWGEVIEGVNSQFITLTALNTTYDDSPTTAVSADIECWNYRAAGVGLTIDSTNTPTDLTISVEVSYDGTNFFKLMNGPLGLWIYDDVATATAISRCLWFPLAAYKIRVRITCTGTTASNTFAVTNACLYLRN
jgi:hypothetical protein